MTGCRQGVSTISKRALLWTALLLWTPEAAAQSATDRIALEESASDGVPYLLRVDALFLGTLTSRAPDLTLQTVLRDTPTGQVAAIDTSTLLQPEETQLYPSAMLWLSAETELTRWLGLRVFLDSGEVRAGDSFDPELSGVTSNARPLDEFYASGEFVRELAVTFRKGGLSLDLGRTRHTVGNGLIYDDFGTGAFLTWDLDQAGTAPLRFSLNGMAVGRTFDEIGDFSPLVTAEINYAFSLFEEIGVFGAWFRDGSSALRDVIGSPVVERVLAEQGAVAAAGTVDRVLGAESSTDLGYVGANLVWIPADGLSLRTTAAVQLGNLSLGLGGPDPFEARLVGFGAQTELHYGLGDHWDMGLVGFGLTGDQPVSGEKRTYRTFIGVAPYWAWSGLFFTGGLTQDFLASRAAGAGVNGHGVYGGGPTVGWYGDKTTVELRVIGLGAGAEPPANTVGADGLFYGAEADITLEWKPLRWLNFFTEFDVFFPGNYFPQKTVAFRSLLWARVGYD